jgi:DNA-binding NarL/FixJ family response regulator
MYRLLTIDDRPVFADGIRRIAEDAGIALDDIVHASPETWPSALDSGPFDAVVINIGAQNDRATDAVRRITRRADMAPVLALSAPCESVYGVRLLRLGAHSVIGADASPEEIATALARTLAGRRHLSQTLADHVLAHVMADGRSGDIRLRDAVASDAQLRLVQLLALGKPIGVICSTLRISAQDAHAQRRDILRRAGLADEEELKRCAFEQRLVPDRRVAGDRRTPTDAGMAAAAYHPAAIPTGTLQHADA